MTAERYAVIAKLSNILGSYDRRADTGTLQIPPGSGFFAQPERAACRDLQQRVKTRIL